MTSTKVSWGLSQRPCRGGRRRRRRCNGSKRNKPKGRPASFALYSLHRVCIQMFSTIINCLVWIKPSPFLKMHQNPPHEWNPLNGDHNPGMRHVSRFAHLRSLSSPCRLSHCRAFPFGCVSITVHQWDSKQRHRWWACLLLCIRSYIWVPVAQSGTSNYTTLNCYYSQWHNTLLAHIGGSCLRFLPVKMEFLPPLLLVWGSGSGFL